MSVNKELLLVPFDPSKIKRRVGGGGRSFDYVPHGDYTARLVHATDNTYDWEIVSLQLVTRPALAGKTDAYWVCEGRLTIPGLGSRSGIGTHPAMDEETPKGAESDALKRAAMKFGLGLQLYTDDESYRDAGEPMATDKQQARVATLRADLEMPVIDVSRLTYQQYVDMMTDLKAVEKRLVMSARPEVEPASEEKANGVSAGTAASPPVT